MDSSEEDGDDSHISKQILVFGSAGTGKTSFVNALTEGKMPTGDGAVGVTFESNAILVNRDGVKYRIIDTVGLNETDKGAVSSEHAVNALVQLLKRVEGGLNLMVMVVQKGRIHESTLDNYRLFVENMTFSDVPLLVVVTHCERETGNMQGWVDANREDFLSRGIAAKEFLATTFATPNPEFDNVEVMEWKIRQSIHLSWGAIDEHSTRKRVDFMKLNGGFMGIARKINKYITRHVGAAAESVSDPCFNTFQRMDNADDRTLTVNEAQEPRNLVSRLWSSFVKG